MRLSRVIAAWTLALLATPSLASTYDQAFVDAFAEACVPGRLAYQSTLDAAANSGWEVVERGDHPELAAVMARSDEGLVGEEGISYAVTLYAREIAGTRHHLAVSSLSSVITPGEPPFVQVGCHLYNFDAEKPVDPAPVSALLEASISYSIDREGHYGHVWGPPCPMPRTFDTYLSYFAADTPAALATGFDGVTLNFSTSTPAEGEEVPETYC